MSPSVKTMLMESLSNYQEYIPSVKYKILVVFIRKSLIIIGLYFYAYFGFSICFVGLFLVFFI
jgi:hypothetical protein